MATRKNGAVGLLPRAGSVPGDRVWCNRDGVRKNPRFERVKQPLTARRAPTSHARREGVAASRYNCVSPRPLVKLAAWNTKTYRLGTE